MSKLTDYDLMPCGDHEGKQMKNVSDVYLRFFWNENIDAFRGGRVYGEKKEEMMYIDDLFDDLL